MKQLHDIQLIILQKLLLNKELHYTEMKPASNMENNQFDWHVKALLKIGLIEQTGENYHLTFEGKKYANRLDTDVQRIVTQAKISVLMVCMRKNSEDENEFLLYTRTKHPYLGCQGFPAGQIKLGETVEEAAKRELKEETGLSGYIEVLQVRHDISNSIENNVLTEDKYMFVCRFYKPSGEIITTGEEGTYEWVKESDIKAWIKKPFSTIDETLAIIDITKTFEYPISLIEEKSSNDKF